MTKICKICLTPVKNEAWILDKFLQATSLWADKIVVIYQQSEDDTLAICKKYPKVVLLYNKSNSLDELSRQTSLINKSRQILTSQKHILFALDADEFLTLDCLSNREFKKIEKLKPGTVIKFDWLNLKLKENKYWIAPQKMPFAYVDDGTIHTGEKIHNPRVPVSDLSPLFFPKNLKVMHYQYADWQRMKSKHRWYQMWETINNPLKNPIDIYRQYHHMYSIPRAMLRPVQNNWFKIYDKAGINLREVIVEKKYWWDSQVLKTLRKLGPNLFKKNDIWDVKWNGVNDPRNIFDRLLILYLKFTQPWVSDKYLKRLIYLSDFLLSFLNKK